MLPETSGSKHEGWAFTLILRGPQYDTRLEPFHRFRNMRQMVFAMPGVHGQVTL